MARTVKEILDEMIIALQADPETSVLTNSSKTARWRTFAYVIAVIINIFERLQDTFKIEVQDIIKSRRIGTLAWYVSAAKDFQLGDDLIELDNGDYAYASIDATKKIISRASAKVEDGEIKLKVAKETNNGAVALTSGELTQFSSYMEDIKFAGVAIEYVSLNADTLDIDCDIYYDGVYATTDIENAVQEAIEEFLKNIKFDGSLNKNSLERAIIDVVGVTDIVFNEITATQGQSVVDIEREYETVAGYINLDGFTVSNFVIDAV